MLNWLIRIILCNFQMPCCDPRALDLWKHAPRVFGVSRLVPRAVRTPATLRSWRRWSGSCLPDLYRPTVLTRNAAGCARPYRRDIEYIAKALSAWQLPC